MNYRMVIQSSSLTHKNNTVYSLLQILGTFLCKFRNVYLFSPISPDGSSVTAGSEHTTEELDSNDSTTAASEATTEENEEGTTAESTVGPLLGKSNP